MSFFHTMKDWPVTDIDEVIAQTTLSDIQKVLGKQRLTTTDYLRLLSPAARNFLEPMALRAHRQTVAQFGRTIVLYTPMYLANYCVNHCVYCGFNAMNGISRKQLDFNEVEKEASEISATGLKHILILTGESRKRSSVDYMKGCIRVLARYFTSIAIEVYPLETSEYRQLIDAGADSMTLYQETYSPELYDRLHLKGPKKNYRFRLDAPERACLARMRGVNIGALLGLDRMVHDSFFTGLHARYLQKYYPDVDISVSFPRMRPHAGAFQPDHPVDDISLVQAILALRLFMPRAGITMSTRESATFRNHVLPLGVTRMSAGSTTVVGGHSQENQDTGQFDISDERSVDEMATCLKNLGYQPVYKDWQSLDVGETRGSAASFEGSSA